MKIHTALSAALLLAAMGLALLGSFPGGPEATGRALAEPTTSPAVPETRQASAPAATSQAATNTAAPDLSHVDLSAGKFAEAEHGVRWALSQLPGAAVRDKQCYAGTTEIRLAALPAQPPPAGEDDYAIRFAPDEKAVSVTANTPCGTIYGLLRLRDVLASGQREDVSQQLRFRTRNYKHELPLWAQFRRGITGYTEATWEALCRQIVTHQFNGLVLYPSPHPFEAILDYAEYPNVVRTPDAERATSRAALRLALQVAHRYGLKTFMQHYVGHFPAGLAEAQKIPSQGRLANVEHPEVDRYCRYCYRELFKQVPELDGLYFNFESNANDWGHVLRNAIPELNSLDRKPIVVYRLWNFNDVEGMKSLLKAYKGRTILAHKVSDTNDTYYLPVADSRCREWKRDLGDIEWMYIVGPCHNCGTNLCRQVWGDYDFVQALLADASAKGGNSISFHTVTELFAPDVPGEQPFAARDREMARFNYLHVRAASDYIADRRLTAAQKADVLADRCAVPRAAGPDLLRAIGSSSRLVLLAYQQFCYGSAQDGYIQPLRRSHIQEPFAFYPASELNDQASRMLFQMGSKTWAWRPKTIDTKVADGFQYIIDFVDPSKRPAPTNPQRLAESLRDNVKTSRDALAAYKTSAGEPAAAALAAHLERNAAFGEYVQNEILAGIALYRVYFAPNKPAVVKTLREGIEELKLLPSVLARGQDISRSVNRSAMLDGLAPQGELDAARELLRLVEETDFPVSAWRDWVESRRLYNEIRRQIRPLRWNDASAAKWIGEQLKASAQKADACIACLSDGRYAALLANAKAWREFLADESARLTPPTAACSTQPSDALPTHHNHCFRAGVSFLDDFTDFFKRPDYLRPADVTFRLWRTKDELVVSLREADVDVDQRLAQWEKYRREGSASFVMRLYVDPANKGQTRTLFIVWPGGNEVSREREPHVKARSEFTREAKSWQMTAYLPWNLLGGQPKPGDTWGFNVVANPAVVRFAARTWAPDYDSEGNPQMLGQITFK